VLLFVWRSLVIFKPRCNYLFVWGELAISAVFRSYFLIESFLLNVLYYGFEIMTCIFRDLSQAFSFIFLIRYICSIRSILPNYPLVFDNSRVIFFKGACNGVLCKRKRLRNGLLIGRFVSRQNACNRTLKRELVHAADYDNHEQAQLDIFKYIETYYNTKRIHSAIGYLSPNDFESKNP